jgi:carbonic anhydrase
MQQSFNIIYSHDGPKEKSINDWTYHNTEEWPNEFPLANGANQSPIDLSVNNSKYDETLTRLDINYNLSSFAEITNTGRSFQIQSDNNESSKISFSLSLFLIKCNLHVLSHKWWPT